MEPCLGNLGALQQPQDGGFHLKHASDDAPVANHTKEGSYGVSIRVQGIGGHPYIVLNNAEQGMLQNHTEPEDSQQDTDPALSRSPPGSTSSSQELQKTAGEGRLCWSTYSALPSKFHRRKQASVDEGKKKSSSPLQAGLPKSSSLLNFQRHPELLQPYNPENNVLDLEEFPFPQFRTSKSLAGEGKMDAESWSSSLGVVASNHTTLQVAELEKPMPKMVDLTMPAAGEDGSQLDQDCSGLADGLNGAHGPPSSSGGSFCLRSPPVVQEARKCRPDLLPFRRQDSAGSLLNGSRRSSSSSATPTSAASLYKFFLDDQEGAIYADNVNRHENRRYVPFLPGTGRDIDTGSIPGVDQLIEKFDKKVILPRRGRLGMRNRIRPEDRKRSRSLDSALSPCLTLTPEGLEERSPEAGVAPEQVWQPARASLPKPFPSEGQLAPLGPQVAPRTVGRLQAATASGPPGTYFNSLQYQKQSKNTSESSAYKSSTLPVLSRKTEHKSTTPSLLLPNPAEAQKNSAKPFASSSKAQVTPDLLKGQQELSEQTNEETAKQILYNYLKEGTGENDDATKRKVNLVFEKIQTLKSRAAGSSQASDPPAEVKVLVEQKKDLEKELSELQRKMDLEVRNQQNLRDERDAMRREVRELQQELEKSLEEKETLQRHLEETEKDLRQNLEELFQVKMEREQHEREIRDLQDQLSEMHDELDRAKHLEEAEKELLAEEVTQMRQDLQDLLVAKEQLEELLRKRERELTALKGALKEEVSSHDLELDRLRGEHEQELRALRESLQEEAALEKVEALSGLKAASEEMRKITEDQVMEWREQNRQLKGSLAELESQREGLQKELGSLRAEREDMEGSLKRCQEKLQCLEEALACADTETRELASAKTSLEAQLEEAQKNICRLGQEQQQLTDRLKNEATEKDQLKRMRSELENERWQLDKTIEQLHKEMAEIIEVSRTSTLELQNQLDEYKEKNRRDLAEMQRQLRDKSLELEKARLAALKLQEEVRFMEEELRDHQRAQDESITKTQLLEQTVKALEYELEAKNHVKEDRARQAKLMEDKASQLERELEEERSNAEILSERIGRCREQIEQMRSELLQERAARQDLECDKISLERQNKDLKSRILHLEGSYRSSKEGLLVQMEGRIVELEERLENEERDRANLQMSNRRLERKVKELMMQVDDEHLSLTDQKDQLSLRLKAMKRQVEEAEEEIDRLESGKKKLQRELEEQVDLNDQLQGQLNAIRQELRRKKTSSKMLSDLDDDDDFSTDGESLYEAPSGFKFIKEDEVKS
ncbi:hypothetical protein JRQ81_006937 [Phrynocephalus forsythii]|uniref:Myosin tail domain-containing protein n=1 Tax=Phrynocephalus forsythii TaxID=171643 RepID=A0A9Q0XE55_9SAUR|nr:hypothetical protein JRQ81_006937 [Phrynocephalus forsythii]